MPSLRSLGHGANLLTLARLPLAVVYVVVARSVAGSIAVLALAGLTDVLDGWYARRTGQSSAFGADLDGLVDKVFVVTVVVALVATGALPLAAALVLGTREAGEMGLGLWLAATHRERLFGFHPHHPLGKVTTVLQFGAILAAVLRCHTVAVTLASAAGIFGLLAVGAYARHERASIAAS